MPAVTAPQLSASLPAVDPRLIAEHVSRLDAHYFERFDEEAITRHLVGLASISPARPVVLQMEQLPGGERACTVLAFDHPGAFSLITGVLSSLGFNIRSGDIFTWSPARPEAPRSLDLRRRRIIDRFTGTVPEGDWSEDWESALSARLTEVFGGLERGGEAAVAARRTVNELAARRLGRIRFAHEAVLYPVQIEVDVSPAGRTRMRVISQDTPFFLFTFSTALTLQEVSIEHVTIRTETEKIQDEFEFVDAGGRAITDPSRIDRIKLSVLLTKQFTSFLESAPDPLAALGRFEQLTRDVIAMPQQGRWVELLSDQGVLRDLAQLLGASTFLWEDFVRLQYEELLPMLAPHVSGTGFCEPLELLPDRLEMALSGAEDTKEFARRLNEFKDREIYLFDLDHILTPGSDFLTLSRRLTALAELVVDAAATHAWRTLRARFGEPRTVAGLPVRCAIMGLGKLGGVALGYASDIE
ncbi:MAG: glutamate-ammonia-ligase adenylyltransferase, partial [Spirochaetia bacterium]